MAPPMESASPRVLSRFPARRCIASPSWDPQPLQSHQLPALPCGVVHTQLRHRRLKDIALRERALARSHASPISRRNSAPDLPSSPRWQRPRQPGWPSWRSALRLRAVLGVQNRCPWRCPWRCPCRWQSSTLVARLGWQVENHSFVVLTILLYDLYTSTAISTATTLVSYYYCYYTSDYYYYYCWRAAATTAAAAAAAAATTLYSLLLLLHCRWSSHARKISGGGARSMAAGPAAREHD
jgi:hypothetical protein